MEQPRQIMLRATLTDEEWKAIRKAAIDADSAFADYVGYILREFLAKAQAAA